MGESHSLFIKGKKNDISVFAMEKKESITKFVVGTSLFMIPQKGGRGYFSFSNGYDEHSPAPHWLMMYIWSLKCEKKNCFYDDLPLTYSNQMLTPFSEPNSFQILI